LTKLHDWKAEFGDKLILCVGNHDFAYMRLKGLHMDQWKDATYISGHQHEHDRDINALFEKYGDMFQLAACIDGVVYSHAGFTDSWLKEYIIATDFNHQRPKSFMKIYNPLVKDKEALIDRLNADFKGEKMRRHFLDHRTWSSIGNDPREGPLWVRPNSLFGESAFQFQVVGHTEYYEVKKMKDIKKMKFVVIVDTPAHNQCALITNGGFETVKIHSVTYDDISKIYGDPSTVWSDEAVYTAGE
jgi:hypothetical protein